MMSTLEANQGDDLSFDLGVNDKSNTSDLHSRGDICLPIPAGYFNTQAQAQLGISQLFTEGTWIADITIYDNDREMHMKDRKVSRAFKSGGI